MAYGRMSIVIELDEADPTAIHMANAIQITLEKIGKANVFDDNTWNGREITVAGTSRILQLVKEKVEREQREAERQAEREAKAKAEEKELAEAE